MASIPTKAIAEKFVAFGKKKKILDALPQWTTLRFHVANSYRFSLFIDHRSPHLLPPFPIRTRSYISDLTSRSLLGPCSPSVRPPLSSMTTQAGADSSQSSSDNTVRVVIKGRVQGVFYRDWTVENATQLGLKGWVRNRRDGSVEALFSGKPEAIQEMEQRCRRGPPSAMVTGLQIFPSNDDPGSQFERRPTA